MRIITREITHPKLSIFYRIDKIEKRIYDNDLGYMARSEIFKNIDAAKSYLVKEKNFKKGHKVVLASTKWPTYLIWFFAVSELGGAFVISDSPKIFNNKVIDHRLRLYGEIHHLICPIESYSVFKSFQDVFVDDIKYENYAVDDEISKLVYCEPDDVLLYSTSSGTTDLPKVVPHTHGFFYDLMDRNARIFDLKESDRCLHTKNLHHGSVLGVYFLPTIKYCRSHYWQQMASNIIWTHHFLHYIKDYRINQCFMYEVAHIEELTKVLTPQCVPQTIKLNVLAKIEPHQIEYLVGECHHEIISIFGCIETSGPLFLLKYDKDNYKTQEHSDFGKPLDDFYQIKLNDDDLLTVIMPNGDEVCTGDKFEIKNDHYYFVSRHIGAKINNIPVYLDLLSQIIEKSNLSEKLDRFRAGKEFDVCIDRERSKLYMRSDYEVNIDELNQYLENELNSSSYNISCIIVAPRKEFITGIKFDAEKLRLDCRERLDLIQ